MFFIFIIYSFFSLLPIEYFLYFTTCHFLNFVFAFELGESETRGFDLSVMDGVEAGLGLVELI